MANELISGLTPGILPYGGGSLIEVSVPTGGDPAYATRSARKVDFLQPTYVGLTVSADLTELQSGSVAHNFGAAGAVQAHLPPAIAPLEFDFTVTMANPFGPLADGSDTIVSDVFSGSSLTCAAVGSTVKLRCIIDGQWIVAYSTGSWT